MKEEKSGQLQPQGKRWYSVDDLKVLYGVGNNKAYDLIRAIEYINGGLVLGKGKVLWSELEYYERNRGHKPGSYLLPSEKEITDGIQANGTVPGIAHVGQS